MKTFSFYVVSIASQAATVGGIFGLAVHANAADFVVPSAEPIYVAEPTSDWSGLYVGVFGGGGGGQFKYPFEFYLRDEVGLIVDDGFAEGNGVIGQHAFGLFGGGQAGYNLQLDGWLLGVEADITATDIRGELRGSIDYETSFGVVPAGATVSGNRAIEGGSVVNWFGTVRARAGRLWTPDFLVYGTGGIAYGGVEHYASGSGTGLDSFSVNTRGVQSGWTLGAGAEYKLTERLSLQTEYLYVDLGSKQLFSIQEDFPNDGVSYSAAAEAETRLHTFQVGMNFAF